MLVRTGYPAGYPSSQVGNTWSGAQPPGNGQRSGSGRGGAAIQFRRQPQRSTANRHSRWNSGVGRGQQNGYVNGNGNFNGNFNYGSHNNSNGTHKNERFYNRERLRIKALNVHPNADIMELKEFFSAYGKVFELEKNTNEFEDAPTGEVFVTFRPAPAPPPAILRREVKFHGRILLIKDITSAQNERFRDRAPRRSDRLNAEQIEMGVLLEPGTFVSEWRCNNDVIFSIDYDRRVIRCEFGLINSENYVHTFKMEVPFQHIESPKIFPELEGERMTATLTIHTKYPAKLFMYDENMESQNKDRWLRTENWRRKVALRTEKYPEEISCQPVAPTYPYPPDQHGKWRAYRVTFNLGRVEGGIERIRQIITGAEEYSLVESADFHRPMRVIDGSTLMKYVDRSMLKFDVLYMIESAITHGYIHDYNLNPQFFNLLAQQSTEVALTILDAICTRKKRIYDPLTFLNFEVAKFRNTEVRPKHVPLHCVMMRKVVVSPTTMYVLPPTMETSNRIIRHFREHKDYFLRVQFVDEAGGRVGSSLGHMNDALFNRVFRVLCNGIQIGSRHYEFLAFSSSQLREHSCWFFSSTLELTADEIRRWMGELSHIDIVAKYAARMGQCFSSTRAVAHLPVSDIKEIPDVERNGYTFSDGCGKISPDLCRLIKDTLELPQTPSAVQFRLGGCKGVLCMSPSVRGNQIQVRPSQRKFDSVHSVLEVIRSSTFLPASLNRQAITLLSTLQVPDKVFIEMKDEQVSNLDNMLSSDHTAMNVLLEHVDEHGMTRVLAKLVKSGFLTARDPFLVNMLNLFRISMLRDLKKKAKISVNKGAFLLGVLDETETLKEEQVYVCVSDRENPHARRVVTGPVILWRNPCFHPGDIRLVNAVPCRKLEHLCDVVVFPAVGYRDIPSMCSGGDLDGDDFTVIWDERLVRPVRNYEPMEYKAPPPVRVDEVTIGHVKKFFVNYISNDNLGMIANAHLARADRAENGAFHGSCLRLAQLHSEAVDFPKTGQPASFPADLKVHEFPEFMEKPDKPSYMSQRVLGELFRSIKVGDFEPSTRMKFDERLYMDGYQLYLDEARKLKRNYDATLRGLMNQYGVTSEYEAVSGFVVNQVVTVENKKPRELTKSVGDAAEAIRRSFRKMFEEEFWGEGTTTVSPEAKYRMESKAFAWYYVTYHPSELGDDAEENMVSFPWIVHDTLCEIAIRNNGRSHGRYGDLYNADEPSGKTAYDRNIGERLRPTRDRDLSGNGGGDGDDGDDDDDDDGMERLRRSLLPKISTY